MPHNKALEPALAIPEELSRVLSYETMRRYGAAPLGLRGSVLRLAMVDDRDVTALDDLGIRTGYQLETVKVSKAEFEDLLKRYFSGMSVHPLFETLTGETGQRGILMQDDAGASAIVEKLLSLAVAMRASDIHLEPQRDGFYARFRVDGILQGIHGFPKALQSSIVSRIKVLSNMDISEKRLPLDGQTSIEQSGKTIDLRISTLPSKYGEKVVIRILDKSAMAVDMDSLGLAPSDQGRFEAMIESPHGLILVTGPTGSGKTTTLYSALSRVRSPLKNIITLEDPIEYELLAGGAGEMGVTQVQVHPKIGLTFASGLRAALRQDPDIIMVGEIRDRETAEAAMTAAMTGHLVLSTLHTNDAVSAVGRLLDMGVEPYLVGSTVIGVLAQRLVRLLCRNCMEEYHPPARALERMFRGGHDVSRAVLRRPRGCARCGGTGYSGRKGIFELLSMTDELRQAVHNGKSGTELGALLKAGGMKNLQESGMDLVFSGLTSAEEISRVSAV